MSELLTIKEAARYLRVNPLTLYRWARQGMLPATKVGRHWRIHQDALEAWLRPRPPSTALSILVVDDEEAIGRLFKGTLERSEYQVSQAFNGEEAMWHLERSDFALIFLDLRMPGMDGVETFRRIREINTQVPVVIITGFPDSDLMTKALEVGPVAVMKKPFGPLDIQQATSSFARQTNGQRG